jgi:hypothetical protein
MLCSTAIFGIFCVFKIFLKRLFELLWHCSEWRNTAANCLAGAIVQNGRVSSISSKDALTSMRFRCVQEWTSDAAPHISRLSIKLYTAGFWPFPPTKKSIPLIPPPLEEFKVQFTKYYKEKFGSRKLFWMWELSQTEILTHCFQKPYLFHASILQTSILLAFNACPAEDMTLSMKDLAQCLEVKRSGLGALDFSRV